MEATDVASVLLRGTHAGALASLFGSLVFSAAVLRFPPEATWAPLLRRRLSYLVSSSLLLALALGIAWFAVRSAAVAGTSTIRETLAALPLVALETRFGRIVLLRIGLLLALTPLCFWFPVRPPRTNGEAVCARMRSLATTARALCQRLYLPAAIVLAGGALALQAVTSHAGATDGLTGSGLVTAEALHVLAAGAWLGSLVPLLICLATMPLQPVALTLRRFFPLGLVAVSVIAVTSLAQAITLVGSFPALVGTTYGRVALLKLLLFLLLLALAALNRFVFSAMPGTRLRRSIAGESGLAILVMLAAASLAQLTPGAHEQAVWPFAWRVNPSGPEGLFVRAWPESFLVSPTGFAADAIVRGEHLYQTDCASCHGATGGGNGVAAASLPAAPADLTAHRLLEYSDGDLFRLAGHEIATSDADRWDLVDYLRAHNTGEFIRTSRRGQFPVRIPRFNAVCANGQVLDGDDLRGNVLRIVVPANPNKPLPRTDSTGTQLVTISLPANAADRLEEAPCVAQYEAREAFAILLGTTPDALAGSEFLIDANLWLRARWRPGERSGWPTSQILAARVKALARSPLPADPAAGHVHRH